MKVPYLTKNARISSNRADGFSLFILYKKQLLFFLLLLFSTASFATPGFKKEKDHTDGSGSNLVWKLDATLNNVSFYHALSECNGKKIAFLKFVNKNNFATKVSWKETVKTQFRAEEKAVRGQQSLLLPPGETFENDCSGTTCKACVILPEQVNPTYLAQIIDVSFKDIAVSK